MNASSDWERNSRRWTRPDNGSLPGRRMRSDQQANVRTKIFLSCSALAGMVSSWIRERGSPGIWGRLPVNPPRSQSKHHHFADIFFAGNTPADILSCYADLTGHAPVPPKWSFGLWVSSGGTYRDRKTLEDLVDGLSSHQIPADVVHVDPWWMKWRTYCDFRWDTEAFPDPGRVCADAAREGAETLPLGTPVHLRGKRSLPARASAKDIS